MKVRSAIVASATVLLVAIVAASAGAVWLSARDAAPERVRCLGDGNASGPHAGMVWIPGGDFSAGDNVYAEEGPFHSEHVSGFWMDRHEVTNAEFAAFVKATGYVTEAERDMKAGAHPDVTGEMRKAGAVVFVMPKNVDGTGDISQWWRFVPGADWKHPGGRRTGIADRSDFPVVEITYADASAYAKWKHRALPTEAEWEFAARGGSTSLPKHEQPKDANTWQGIFPVLDRAEDGFAGLAPVGCYKANAYGLYDMIGNVWEWTADLYASRRAAQPAADEPRRVIKGGSFLCAENYCMRYRAGSRQPQEQDLAVSHLGFRTILRAPAPR